jgi:signal transduction histidine kinase
MGDKMNPISAFFVRNIIVVFFFYGLAFFCLGLALALASRRESEFRFVQAIVPLALFGFLHGIHEWVEMYQKIAVLSSGYLPTTLHEILRLLLLVASFAMLLGFGFTLLSPAGTSRRHIWLPVLGIVGFWLTAVVVIAVVLQPGDALLIAQADALARYSLGIPAALLGAWALMTQQRTFREANMPQFGRDLIWATTALLLFGVIGQFFVRETTLVPSNIINSALFLQWFGIPVQLFRALAAIMLLVFMIRALKAFDVETRRRLDAANQARLNALNQVVDAQELERKRIARELHDATGQSLTAIALGLRGVEMHIENCDSPPVGLLHKVREIKGYSTNALGELHQIIADLRPQILDDMGLAAALKWYVQNYQQRRSLPSELIVEGTPYRLPAEYETVLFRITQEALTNIAKHARATCVIVTLSFSPVEVSLIVQDNGRGFDPEQALQRNGRNAGWGLLGMRERASLIGGQAAVESSPGQGARIRVTVPTSRELIRVKDSLAIGR